MHRISVYSLMLCLAGVCPAVAVPVYSFSDFAVFSGGKFSTGKNVTIQGPVGALGQIWINNESTTGSVLGAGKVGLGKDVNVLGDVGYVSKFSAHETVAVSGTVFQQSVGDLPGALGAPGFAGVGGSETIQAGSTVSLSPGSYGSLTVGKESTIHLVAGHYVFDSVWLDKESSLLADTATGAVTIEVVGKVSTGKEVSIGSQGAHRIQIISGGNQFYNKENEITADLISFGKLDLASESILQGTAYGDQSVWLGKEVQVLKSTSIPEASTMLLLMSGVGLLRYRRIR